MNKITCCQYEIEKLADWDAYVAKVTALVVAAKDEGSELVLLPEYAGIEIVCDTFDTDIALFQALQPLIPQYIALFQGLAREKQIYIQAGTIIEKIATDHYVNRAYLFSPNGAYAYQDKLQLTEYEKKHKVMKQGQQQTVFNTALGKIAIAICYDSEFPEIVRGYVQAGAELILVPSYTSTLAGFYRVFLSSRARAIENQCYVAVSFVVNAVALSDAAEIVYGQAVMLGPVDVGFPDDGIVAQGKMNQVGVVTSDISFQRLASVRRHGQVRNYFDMGRYRVVGIQDVDLWEF